MKLRAAPLSAMVTAAIIVAGFGFCWAANWPGHLSYDSVIQLLEGRTAVYANWHPPVMSWLLGLGDAVWPGAGLFVLFVSLLAYGALFGLLALRPPRSWAAPFVAVVLILTPQFLIYPAIVWKDVLFAVANAAGFVLLALAARVWPRPYLRFGLLGAGFVLLVLAALARQNGILVLLAGTVTLAWMTARKTGRAVTGIYYGGGALALALLVGLAGRAGLDLRVTGEEGPATQIRLLQSYDLIGGVARDPVLPLSHLDATDPLAAKEIRTDGVRLYSPERNDTLAASDELMDALNNATPHSVSADWWAMILHRPGLYLATRWAAFRWLFFTPDLAACHPYFMGLSGPPEMMKALGVKQRWDARDAALARYAGYFARTPFFWHPLYAMAAILLLVLFLRRGRAEDIAMAGLLAGVLLHAASFFVISIACDYRYLYALDLAAMLGVFYLALDPKSVWTRERLGMLAQREKQFWPAISTFEAWATHTSFPGFGRSGPPSRAR